MNVLHVVHGFPPETSGGTERTVEALARAMQRLGCTVTVAAGSLRLGNPGEPTREDHDGLPVLRLHRDDLWFESWFKTFSPPLSEGFARLLARLQPDVVHVHHWLRLTSDLARIARAAGCTVAVTCHDYFAVLARPVRRVHEPAPAPPPAPAYVSAGEAAEAFAFHRRDFADELRAAHLRLVPSRAHAVGLAAAAGRGLGEFEVAAPPHLGSPLRPLPERVPRGRHLLTWGTLYPEKGIETALDALARVPRDLGYSLTVLGEAHDPEFAAHLRARAQGLDVRFGGAFTPADLQRCEADYALLPSLAAESYGLVLDEALQLGLPILASDVPAYRERAPGASTAFFPAGDAVALAALLSAPDALARLARPQPPDLLDADRAAADLLARYRAARARPAAPYAPEVTDRERAAILFRRAERRLWSALQRPDPPAPPW